MIRFAALLALASFAVVSVAATSPEHVVVGSKRFTESYVLGEIVSQTAASSGAEAQHRPGLGSTAVVLEALKAGAIDVYPEYIGTIEAEILKLPPHTDTQIIQRELAKSGLAMGVPLGFSNSYALATTSRKAGELKLAAISDLRVHPDLVMGISQEFLGRADGWPGMASRYHLPQRPTGLDHGLAYSALESGRIDVMDIYTTDAKIAELGLTVLRDDANYFPRYDAVLLYRLDLPARAPNAWRAIGGLESRIDVEHMIRMNADAELHGKTFAAIAADFVGTRANGQAPAASTRASVLDRLFGPDLWRLTREHLWLVIVSVAIATLIGVPLGAIAAAFRRVRQGILGIVNLLQTIPSLAMLAALIPLLGRIGTAPAIVALSLYALLPIVRNTIVGLQEVPDGLRQAGSALGMTRMQLWRHVELPLAMTVILAGIKTASVLTVGTATVAAFIGAGGYGERIAQGLALNDSAMLLAGAIPSAALALVTQFLFELLERMTLHRGRR